MKLAKISRPSAKLYVGAAIVFVASLLSACAGSSGPEPLANLTRCPDQRPQMCTREYNPVCGQLADSSTRTFATGCTACADPQVIGWVAGACASPE